MIVIPDSSNALWRLRRTRKIDDGDAAAALGVFSRLPITYVPIHDLYAGAYRIGVTLDHSLYDCTFLALADSKGGVVVSNDRRLMEKAAARGMGHRVMPMADFTPHH